MTHKLFKAITAGNVELLEQFLSEDTVDILNPSGYPPLSYAILVSQEACMKTILKHGANINQAAGPSEYTPLMIAAATGKKKLLEDLIRLDKMKSAIGYNLTDIRGNTALMLAVREGHHDCVALLKAHTDLTIVNYDGDTAAHLTTDETLLTLLATKSVKLT